MQKKLIDCVLNFFKRNLYTLLSSRLKGTMKPGMSFRSLHMALRISKFADQLLPKFGPLVLFHGTGKAVILVRGMYFNAILKALFRFDLSSQSFGSRNSTAWWSLFVTNILDCCYDHIHAGWDYA